MTPFDSAVTDFLKFCADHKQLSGHTIKAYRIDLSQVQCFWGGDEYPAPGRLESYVTYLHQHYKPKSVKRKIASLHAFCTWMVRQSILEVSPLDKLDLRFREPQKLPQYITLSDMSRLLSAAYQATNDATLSDHSLFLRWRDVAVLEMLFATGIRVSELCGLKMEHFDLEGANVRILGKGSKERIVTISNSAVLQSLRTYQSYRPKTDNHFVFLNRHYRHLSDQSVRILIARCAEMAHINQSITPHMIRHGVATLLLEQGMDIRYIQHILGHSSIRTTQIYTHISSPQQAHLLSILHPRNTISPEAVEDNS